MVWCPTFPVAPVTITTVLFFSLSVSLIVFLGGGGGGDAAGLWLGGKEGGIQNDFFFGVIHCSHTTTGHEH